MTHRAEFGCVWCESGCKFAGLCGNGNGRNAKCPKPEIFFVSPSRGPVEGGTRVAVGGINLRPQKDVVIGGRTCRTVVSGSSSVSPSEIECETPTAARPGNASVHVRGSGNNGNGIGFVYADFSVLRAEPKFGPISGGIPLTVFGENLDIGSRKQVFLDDVPCEPHNASQSRNHLVCFLAPSSSTSTSNLTVRIDHGIRWVPFRFRFTPDPIVRHVKPLESYSSGGRKIVLNGERFNTLPPCKLIARGLKATSASTESCRVLSDTTMECLSPPAPDSSSSVADLGLRCGRMKTLLRLRSAFPNVRSTLTYALDPVLKNSSSADYKIFGLDENLAIEGEGLSAASDTSDVRVFIGDSECNVTSISDSLLFCQPSASSFANAGDTPDIRVQIGESLRYELGRVRLASSTSSTDEISSEVIGLIGAAAAVLVFFAIVILIVLKHKSSETEREYKRIQIQMDILEHNVRSECKQAFAELQTDMTDLTAELEASGTGKPILGRREFLMKAFYPGVRDHPVIATKAYDNWQTPDLKNLEHCLLQRDWLLTWLMKLEYDALGFGVRDKVNLASLLSVFLSTRMKYFSEILKALLTELSHRRPEALIRRRTETMTEKLLTNWLAVCLYDYAKDEIGPDLFYLYKAIKYQVCDFKSIINTMLVLITICSAGGKRSG